VKRFTIFIALIVVLLAGGGLTALLISSGGSVLPILQQVGSPDASPMAMMPWKANQFFILIAFVLFNLIGMAVTIGIVLWLLDWGIKRSKSDAKTAQNQAASAEQS
jgi:predicted membrane protein